MSLLHITTPPIIGDNGVIPQLINNIKTFLMAIAFKKYQKAESNLVELGTLKSLAGKGGKIAFIRKNFADKSKRVALLVTKKDGNSAIIPCSKQISDLIRNNEITISQLAGLQVVEGENEAGDTTHFIVMPQGGGMQEISTDKLKDESFEPSAEFLPEGLLDF